jgi:hypothetical protein
MAGPAESPQLLQEAPSCMHAFSAENRKTEMMRQLSMNL